MGIILKLKACKKGILDLFDRQQRIAMYSKVMRLYKYNLNCNVLYLFRTFVEPSIDKINI